MIAKIKKWLGLCKHEWEHASNTVDENGRMMEVLYCNKCHRFSFRRWPRN